MTRTFLKNLRQEKEPHIDTATSYDIVPVTTN